MGGLFGGIDMGTAADRQKLVLTHELEFRRKTWDRPRYRFQGGADLCLQHGKFRPGRDLPDQYKPLWSLDGTTCYINALLAAQADSSLRYCEGYSAVGRGDFISHAWCIAPDDGVLEVTYPTNVGDEGWATTSLPSLPVLPPRAWGYWGVTFRTELVELHNAEPLHLPFLDRSRAEEAHCRSKGWAEETFMPDHDHPILKLPYNPERTGL